MATINTAEDMAFALWRGCAGYRADLVLFDYLTDFIRSLSSRRQGV
jgi:hypothetical protein